MTSSLPYVPLPLASKRWVVVRCGWCNKPNFDVQAVGIVRFKCNDRGCRMANEIKVG